MEQPNSTQVKPAIRIVAILLALPYLIIGIKELISPIGIDVTFGIPLNHQDGLQYLRVVGARNIVLSLLGIYFASTRVRSTMIAFFLGLALMAALDCYLVTSSVGFTSASIKHSFFVCLLVGMAGWVYFSKHNK